MKWYWVLLIVIGCQGVFLLILWLVTRSKRGRDVSSELIESYRKRLDEELAAEQEKTKAVSEAYKDLSAKFAEIGSWYARNREKIEQEAKDDLKALTGNPNSIDAWLDSFAGDVPGAAGKAAAEEGGEGSV